MHITSNGLDLPQTAMMEMETLSLERCARGKICLELGAEYGYSTVVMGRIAKSVLSVDWHRGYPNCAAGPTVNDTLLQHFYNIKEVRDTVTSIVGKFEVVLPLLKDDTFEFIFLDGGHDFEQVTFCFLEARRLLKPGGVFACHDYGHPVCAELAVAEALGTRPRVPVVGTFAIFDDYKGANFGQVLEPRNYPTYPAAAIPGIDLDKY